MARWAGGLALLRDVFRLHPLALEDVEEFGQRPKLEDFGDVSYLVAYEPRARARISLRCTASTQLTVIATIFLPLSFLTGFFGQNFGWMVTRLGGLPTFLLLGIGTEVAAAIGLFTLFRRRGWF